MTLTSDSWETRHIVRTMLPLLFLLSLLEMGAGTWLEGAKNLFLDAPSLLVLLPVMIGMGGNLGSMLASRISTGLYLGTMQPRPRDTHIKRHVVAVFGLSLTITVLVTLAAYGIEHVTGGTAIALSTLLSITIPVGISLAAVVSIVGVATPLAAYRYGIDPDDVAIPIVTNTCDIAGVVLLIAFVLLLT